MTPRAAGAGVAKIQSMSKILGASRALGEEGRARLARAPQIMRPLALLVEAPADKPAPAARKLFDMTTAVPLLAVAVAETKETAP